VEGSTQLLSGFKKFLMRGNVVDLAVAVVIGTAFTALISALVENIVMPLVTAIFGKPEFSDLNFKINGAIFSYGNVINAFLTFLSVAAAVYFVIVMPLNRVAELRRAKTGAPAPSQETEKELLAEIRDLLRGSADGTRAN
jgi:large conductance mechanosensitive channel